jgi:hypothetical protein
MPVKKTTEEQLRRRIEATFAQQYPVAPIEEKIAVSLRDEGRFEGQIGSEQLANILRHLVYTVFARQQFAGHDVNLVHNVPSLKVAIDGDQADVQFTVHIHRPIVAFLGFAYGLVNDPVSVGRKLRVKRGTLLISKRTRRLDIKAKTALAAINVERLARKELANVNSVISSTLPEQLERYGLVGRLNNVELALQEGLLYVCLEGTFRDSDTTQETEAPI